MRKINVPYEAMFNLMQFQDAVFYSDEKQITLIAGYVSNIHDNLIIVGKIDIIKLLLNREVIINNQITLTL